MNNKMDFDELRQHGVTLREEQGTDSIEAYAVKFHGEVFYLCRDNGSFEVIDSAAFAAEYGNHSFDEWLEDFDNRDELEEEGII